MLNRILLLFTILNYSLQAQIAPNLVFEDINGVNHNLYEYLDQGKSVLLDFFIVNCTPCQEGAGYLENLYLNYGPEGTDQLQILSIEVYNNSDLIVQNAISDWSITNPVINLDEIPSSYLPFVPFYPTYIMVCPDRSMSIITDFNNPETTLMWEFDFNTCNYGNTITDVNFLEPEIIYCQDYVYANLNIGNVGSTFVNNIDIEVFIDSMYHSTIEWDYLLPPLSTSNDVFIPIIFESYNIEGEEISFSLIHNEDINSANNNLEYNFSEPIITLNNQIKIEIQNDYYPGDIYWTLKNANGTVVAFGDGDDYNIEEFVSIDLTLDSLSCYTFTIIDEYGDGICCSHGDGYYQIIAGQDTLAFNNTFSTHKMHSFYVDSEVSIYEPNTEDLIVRKEFYNLNGQAIKSTLISGVHIQKNWHQNGNISFQKILITH